jgi:hypothetical protein
MRILSPSILISLSVLYHALSPESRLSPPPRKVRRSHPPAWNMAEGRPYHHDDEHKDVNIDRDGNADPDDHEEDA